MEFDSFFVFLPQTFDLRIVLQTKLDDFLIGQSTFPSQPLSCALHFPQSEIFQSTRMWNEAAVIFQLRFAVFVLDLLAFFVALLRCPDFRPDESFGGKFEADGFVLRDSGAG